MSWAYDIYETYTYRFIHSTYTSFIDRSSHHSLYKFVVLVEDETMHASYIADIPQFAHVKMQQFVNGSN